MATVVDIEPASLAVTPGAAEVFTLSVTNDGEEVEAYHLSAVDEAADHVVIEPETLLVHPGQTGTAVATLTLEHTGRWAVGDLIVRFHVVPAVRPDEFLVVEAIVTVESFSDVAAVLTPPTLEGRRRAEAEIGIANAGNSHTYADIAVSAGELTVAIDQAHLALPAGSSEAVDLTVRARSLLWRGEPLQHPFIVMVTPEGQPAVSIDGTFTQRPLLPGWTFIALIGVAAAATFALVLWIGVALWNSLQTERVAEPVASTSAAPAAAVEATLEFAPVDVTGTAHAGDLVSTTLAVDLGPEEVDLPTDTMLAIALVWPPQVAIAASSCEAWVDPETDEVLADRLGQLRAGDECLIDPTRAADGVDVGFTTPPGGFTGEISATATRFLTLDGDEARTPVDEAEVELEADSRPADLPLEATAYPFWMEVEVDAPEDPDSTTRQASIWVHRTLDPQGDDERAQLSFDLSTPDFVDDIDLGATQHRDHGCDSGSTEDLCILNFVLAGEFLSTDLDLWEVPIPLDIVDHRAHVGLIAARGTSLTVGSRTVAQQDLDDFVLDAAAPIVVRGGDFPVQVELDGADRDGEEVEATIELNAESLPNDGGSNADREDSRIIEVVVEWSDRLELDRPPVGCSETDPGRMLCSIPTTASGDPADITLTFTVDEDSANTARVAARAAMLTYLPDDAAGLSAADRRLATWPMRWTASTVTELPSD